MKVVYKCICCSSKNMKKGFGWFEPFLAQRYFEYPPHPVTLNESKPHLPVLLTGIFKCNVCGVNFTQLRPDEDEMSRYYHDYGSESHTRARAAVEPSLPKNLEDPHLKGIGIKNKENKIREFLSKHIDITQVRTLLDYGGGDGVYMPTFFNLSKAYSYDISSEKGNRPNVEQINSIDKIDPVDFVLLMEVLEHVSQPSEILFDLKSVVKKGTAILITVPHDCFDAQPDMFHFAYHEHINRYSEKSIAALVRSCGYNVLGLESIAHEEPRYGDNTMIRSIYCLATPSWLD